MTPTPPLDLAALTVIAKGATPGPWEACAGETASEVNASTGSLTWDDHGGEVFRAFDARHIAAFDPPTVLALIARVERAEGASRFHDAGRENWQARAEAAEAKVARVRQIVDNDGIEVDTRDYGAMLAVNADDISVALEDTALDGTP